jgi:hypothetical protein
MPNASRRTKKSSRGRRHGLRNTPRNPPGRRGRLPTRASHRSGRAQLRHPARQATASLRTAHRVDHTRRRMRMTPQQLRKRGPGKAAAPRATRQPFPPGTLHRVTETTQPFDVARYSVVRKVTTQLLPQCLMLLRDRTMAVLPAPLSDPADRLAEPARGRATLHHPVPLQRPAPLVRETQQVKRSC